MVEKNISVTCVLEEAMAFKSGLGNTFLDQIGIPIIWLMNDQIG